MSLHDLTWTFKSIFGSFMLLLFCGYVWAAGYSVKKKKTIYAFAGISGLILCFVILEMLFVDTHRYLQMEKSEFAIAMTNLPSGAYIGLGALLFLGGIVLNYQIIRGRKSRLSPDIVESFSDMIPVGICYFRDDGKVIFFNYLMESLCKSITGGALLNGESFARAIEEKGNYLEYENEIWQFIRKQKVYKDRSVHELLAFNVTEISEKNAQLQSENEKLLLHNERLKEYYLRIDEIVREQEILQAKIDIHDSMNELILMTRVAAASEQKKDILPILEMWKQNIYLLAKEKEKQKDYYSEIKSLADMLGITLTGITDLKAVPKEYQELFCQAAREAIANAVKHSNARNMEITVSKDESSLIFGYTSDGDVPKGPISFKGGLLSLEKRVKDYKGSIRVQQEEGRFSILLII